MKHPEQRNSEVFITNSPKNGNEVGWKTKRVGRKAYNVHGERVYGYRPVFASRAEIVKMYGETKFKERFPESEGDE